MPAQQQGILNRAPSQLQDHHFCTQQRLRRSLHLWKQRHPRWGHHRGSGVLPQHIWQWPLAEEASQSAHLQVVVHQAAVGGNSDGYAAVLGRHQSLDGLEDLPHIVAERMAPNGAAAGADACNAFQHDLCHVVNGMAPQLQSGGRFEFAVGSQA